MPHVPAGHSLLPVFALALACSACGPAPEDPARRAAMQPAPAPAPPAQSPGAGDPARYLCDDGSAATIAATGEQATVQLPEGRNVALPKAQSASKGGGDVFVGETLSLQRDGDAVALFLEGGERTQCHAAGTE